jgi:hypothetical protein
MRENKTEWVRTVLENGHSITSKDAFDSPYILTRLSSVIHNLRNRGIPIITITHKITEGDKTVGSYAEYKLNPSLFKGEQLDFTNRVHELSKYVQESCKLSWRFDGGKLAIGVPGTTEQEVVNNIDDIYDVISRMKEKLDQLWGQEEEKRRALS